MKKHVLLLFAVAGCCATSFAQGITYFYPTEFSERTVEPFPPAQDEYVMTETYYDNTGRNNNSIHFVRYRHAGGVPVILVDSIFDHPKHDERNVDICYIPTTKNFFQVSYAQDISTTNGNSFVKVHIVNANGQVLLSNAFESADPDYPSLVPLDGAYDAKRKEYIVAGTAIKHISDYTPDARKVAFVAKLDAGLNMLIMRFYDSDPGLGERTDYDIANKIIVDKVNYNYYITGSENVDKNGKHVMGLRNMLLDPVTLAPIWRNPLQFTDLYSQENSVDMVEAPYPGAITPSSPCFYVLSNSTSGDKWHILRVDPNTGLPYTNNFATTIYEYKGYGHSITEGNTGKDVVVSGMKFRYFEDCQKQDREATPFMATVDVSSWVGTLTNHMEYYTSVGNVTYWNTGDFYAPFNGYPVPSYLNNFADREAPGMDYGLVTPIYNSSGQLNTKYLHILPSTENGCDDIRCAYKWDYKHKVVNKQPRIWDYETRWVNADWRVKDVPTRYEKRIHCRDGWNKPGQTTAIGEVENPAEDIHLYPNPATNEITVTFNDLYKNKSVQVALYDVVGKLITVCHNGPMDKTTMKFTLPEAVTSGIYLLQINTAGQETITRKIMVER